MPVASFVTESASTGPAKPRLLRSPSLTLEVVGWATVEAVGVGGRSPSLTLGVVGWATAEAVGVGDGPLRQIAHAIADELGAYVDQANP